MKDGTKICNECGADKPHADFHRNTAARDGCVSRCKACVNAYGRRRYQRDRERLLAKGREYHHQNREKVLPQMRARSAKWRAENPDGPRDLLLRYKYGLTLLEWNALFAAQKHACAACGTTEPGGGRNLWHTDHCHETGVVRGILCASCNVALGQLGDSLERIQALGGYLLRSTSPSQSP